LSCGTTTAIASMETAYTDAAGRPTPEFLDLGAGAIGGLTLTPGPLQVGLHQVAGSVDVGTEAHFEGVILSQTAINLGTGTSINGRLLAQTAVSIAGSTVTAPAE
jgi:Ice-binding-like